MSTTYWRDTDEGSYEEVTSLHPFPVQIPAGQAVTVRGRFVQTDQIIIPGTSTTAYAANDAYGQQIGFAVPTRGIIQVCQFWEPSDNAVAAELWLFRDKVGTIAADNAAFSLVDADLLNVVAVIAIGTFYDAINGMFAREDALNIEYYAPASTIYGLMKIMAASTLVLGSEPRIRLGIEPLE